MYSDVNLINAVLNQDETAQSELYKQFAPKMFGICLRFARNRMEADDMLQEGFIKVFLNLNTFRREGSLEGWIRRTMVNTAINLYKKNIRYTSNIVLEKTDASQNNADDLLQKLKTEDLLKMIMDLPTGYRMVFNLYVLEGYTHNEISKMLGISENTSKSQLSRARSILKNKIIFMDNLC